RRSGSQRHCARPPRRRDRDPRAARPVPDRPVGVAEPDLEPRLVAVPERLHPIRAMIVKPHVDWFALAPSLALLAASGLLLMVAVFVPRRGRKSTSVFLAFAGFVASGVWAAFLDDRSPS